jgi:hypothetical protein
MPAPWLSLPCVRLYYRLNVCSVTILALYSFVLQAECLLRECPCPVFVHITDWMSAPWLSLSCIRSYYRLNVCSVTIIALCSFILQTECLLRDYPWPLIVHITDRMSAPWLSLTYIRSYYTLNVCSMTILALYSFILQTECLLRDYSCPVFVNITDWMSAPWLSLSCFRSYYKLNVCSVTILALCLFIL